VPLLSTILRVIAAGAALLVVQALASGLVSVWFGPPPRLPGNALGWVVLSDLLTAGILALIARRSSLRGSALAARLAVVFFGISTFNGMIEALFFHVVGSVEFVRYVLQGAVTAILFCFALVVLLGRRRAERPAPARMSPAFETPPAWRLAAADLLYVFCYFAAGAAIYPWVRAFYEGRGLPARPLVAAMQILVRGPIFIGLVLLMARMVDGERWEKAALAGAALSLLGGVAPLLIPNPYLPDPVRWAHFFEVGVSNFVFGWISAWMLSPPPARVAALAGSSA
jgi:Ca2+/Na+ antiporter